MRLAKDDNILRKENLMPQLSCRNLAIGYNGKTIAKNISFDVNKEDYLCIVGENGSGKSTLIKTILHLTPAISGEIITGDGLVSNEIGYLPQQTEAQKDFPASVKEVVRSGCLNRCGLRPFYNKHEKQMAKEYMQFLGISHLEKKCYRELSGGQQQRVLLARALCAAKKTLLLDEPAAGLDPKAATEMYDLINKLNKNGITIIAISHDIKASLRHASHILHMGGKRILFFGASNEYVTSEIGSKYAAAGVDEINGDA